MANFQFQIFLKRKNSFISCETKAEILDSVLGGTRGGDRVARRTPRKSGAWPAAGAVLENGRPRFRREGILITELDGIPGSGSIAIAETKDGSIQCR
jgi:hypothetical protein